MITAKQYPLPKAPASNEPDRFCVTTPDGGCISTHPECIHNKYHRLLVDAHDTQQKLDSVMLEHCPTEMTEEQLANWAQFQTPVAE